MRVRLGILAVVGLLQGLPALGQIESRRREVGDAQADRAARASCDKAAKALEKRELDKARKEVAACLERSPELTDGHFILAKIGYLDRRYEEALAHMQKAESTYATSAARVVDEQRDRRVALTRQRDQLRIRMEDLRSTLGRATSDTQRRAIEERVQEYAQQRDEIERVLTEPVTDAMGLPADYHFFHGNIALRLERVDDAVSQYREALRIRPDHRDAVNNLASLYLGARRAPLAKEVLDKAETRGVKVNPELKKAVLEALGSER